MLYYIYSEPPKQNCDFELIEKLIFERYTFFNKSNSNGESKENKFLENESLDQLSHFFLCLIGTQSVEVKESIKRVEIDLFKLKLKNVRLEKLVENFELVLNYLEGKDKKTQSDMKYVIKILRAVVQHAEHLFHRKHSESCRKIKIIIPFTSALTLVAKREVELSNGKCKVPCGKWKKLFEILFDKLMEFESNEIKQCPFVRQVMIIEDDRVRMLVNRFENYFVFKSKSLKNPLSLDDLDLESQYFPPCMSKLHQTLRLTHRLSYESRYQYSLFLKDIGLSVEENLGLWSEEYSKPYEGSSCTHDWSDKKFRYSYQIKHMYGLIGTITPKTSFSCSKFISSLSNKMNSGCPFQHNTEDEIRKSLPWSMLTLPDIEDLFSYKKNSQPQKCCSIYLKSCIKLTNSHRNNANEIQSPLNYYMIRKSCV